MAKKYIKTIIDTNGDTVFPRTRANAVTMSDGETNLETKIKELSIFASTIEDVNSALELIVGGTL
jgi:hypothetical protein